MESFNSEFGKTLKLSGMYVVQKLSPFVNSLDDDQYYIDFEIIKINSSFCNKKQISRLIVCK